MATLQLIQITPDELNNKIKSGVQEVLTDLLQNFNPSKPEVFYTREQASKVLDCDLSTLHKWSVAKKLNKWGLGHRVYYKHSEIEAAMVLLNP